MSTDFVVRLIGMFVFGIAGAYFGNYLGADLFQVPQISQPLYTTVIGFLGALFGLVLSPYITTHPMRYLRSMVKRIDARTLVAALVGLIAGLVVAALLSFPISLLPKPFGEILPFFAVILMGYFGVAVFVMRQQDIFHVLSTHLPQRKGNFDDQQDDSSRKILVDTSVIIDGRIVDIARTGFIAGSFLIPRFVLNELQYIADSADSLRRQRGRRGMEVLSKLREESSVPVVISDIDVEGTREVDDKLVILARQLKCPVLTNDYNLNRIAELQGVSVLNINELANSVKAALLPGERIKVDLIQQGKEIDQGVGYLDDGTMVVVEDGVGYLQKEIYVVVTKVLQTAAGRMIFARPEDGS